jgi:outer membrane protein assembly factor BamE (lipoprotein component of BamABCDE complex)
VERIDEERAMLQAKTVLRIRRAWCRGLAAAALVLSLPACGTNVQVHGNLPDPELIAEIQPGTYARQDVVGLLGSPSTVSTFQDNKWYYIGQRTTKFAFFKPKILERNILVVAFDGDGRVSQTRSYTLVDARDIDPVDRVTPTEGREFTLLQQLLGNIGRFSQEQLDGQ